MRDAGSGRHPVATLAKKFAKRIAWLRWRLVHGDRRHRLDYPLTRESVVLDVGGFKGDWAARLVERFDPWVMIFEPIPEHVAILRARFAKCPKVRVFDYGLGAGDADLLMNQRGEGSSVLDRGGNAVACRIRDIAAVWKELSLDNVDLMKVNIEGAEFDLLPRMFAVNLVTRCRDLQIQFHEFFPSAGKLRRSIRRELGRTHKPTYSFYFIWENWRRTSRSGSVGAREKAPEQARVRVGRRRKR